MRRAIQEYRIAGIKANLPLFAEILSDPEFLSGNTHTWFLEERQRRGGTAKERPPAIFRTHALAAALAYAESVEDLPLQPGRQAESAWKRSGRPGFSAAPRR
jgi:pyruvate carboxylase subunit A